MNQKQDIINRNTIYILKELNSENVGNYIEEGDLVELYLTKNFDAFFYFNEWTKRIMPKFTTKDMTTLYTFDKSAGKILTKDLQK